MENVHRERTRDGHHLEKPAVLSGTQSGLGVKGGWVKNGTWTERDEKGPSAKNKG